MEARPWDVAVVLVRRNLGAGGFEQRPVANGPATHADGARSELHLIGRKHSRFSLEHEDLPAPCIYDWHSAWRPGGEGVERRDAGDGNSEREREPARGRQSDADAGEAARADADREPFQLTGMRARLAEQGIDVLEHRNRARRSLAEHLAVGDER